jgi:hypothetical protein
MRKSLFSFAKAFLACLSLLLVFYTEPALAQSTNASITGTVTDAAGGALPGATIIVRNESTGFQTGTVTNASGAFTFRQLPLGKPYTITASFVGYGEQKRTGYALNQGEQINAVFKLAELSTELNEVVITGEGLNNVEQLGAVTSVNATQIKNLPLEGRNFTNLTSLSPLQGAGSLT